MTKLENIQESVTPHLGDGISRQDLRALLRERRAWHERINRRDELDDERLLQVVDDLGMLVDAVSARAAS